MAEGIDDWSVAFPLSGGTETGILGFKQFVYVFVRIPFHVKLKCVILSFWQTVTEVE